MPAHASITVVASPDKVWEHLTNPKLIEQYFFGTNVETDWVPGHPIFFRGEWQGKPYEERGKVLEFKPPEKLSYLFWSSFSGLPDLPENYQEVTMQLRPEQGRTLLAVTQECPPEKTADCESNWRVVLEGLKKQVESGRVD